MLTKMAGGQVDEIDQMGHRHYLFTKMARLGHPFIVANGGIVKHHV